MKYKPHDYQAYATNFILEHPISAVFLDMGLGKSVITLSAIFDLCLDYFSVRKVLVIAPLRVARDTCSNAATVVSKSVGSSKSTTNLLFAKRGRSKLPSPEPQ